MDLFYCPKNKPKLRIYEVRWEVIWLTRMLPVALMGWFSFSHLIIGGLEARSRILKKTTQKLMRHTKTGIHTVYLLFVLNFIAVKNGGAILNLARTWCLKSCYLQLTKAQIFSDNYSLLFLSFLADGKWESSNLRAVVVLWRLAFLGSVNGANPKSPF